MFQEKIDSRSLLAWTAAAMAAPMAHFFGSVPWYLILGEGACAAALWLAAWNREPRVGKAVAVVQFLFLALALSQAAAACGGSWVRGQDNWAVAVSLLVLSAWAASHGGKTGSRYGAVVFLLSLLLYGVLLFFAVPDTEPRYLLPAWRWDGGAAFGILLIPGVLSFFPRQTAGRSPWPWALGLSLFGGALAALTAGCLSPWVAAETQGAFFQMVRGISILGIAERFEALVSGVMTMGWFCLMSLLLAAEGHLTEVLLPGRGKAGVWTGAALAGILMLWADRVPEMVLPLGALAFWGVLPLILSRRKKLRENEK